MRMLIAKALGAIGFLLLLVLGAVGIYGIYYDFTAGPPTAAPTFPLPSRLPGVAALIFLSVLLYPPAAVALLLSFILSTGGRSLFLKKLFLASAAIHIVWYLSLLSSFVTAPNPSIEPVLILLLALPIIPMATLYWFSTRR